MPESTNYQIVNHPRFKLMPGMLVYTGDLEANTEDFDPSIHLFPHRIIDECTAHCLTDSENWYCGDDDTEPNGIVAVDTKDPATLGCLMALGFTSHSIERIHTGTHYSQNKS